MSICYGKARRESICRAISLGFRVPVAIASDPCPGGAGAAQGYEEMVMWRSRSRQGGIATIDRLDATYECTQHNRNYLLEQITALIQALTFAYRVSEA